MAPTTRRQTEHQAHDNGSSNIKPDTNHTTFECSICLDLVCDESIDVVGDKVCKECFVTGVKPLFIAAILDENQYPVKWGGINLDIRAFRRFFNNTTLTAYAAKVFEYGTPVRDRLYCEHQIVVVGEHEAHEQQCNGFLGNKRFLFSPTVICQVCKGYSCSDCGAVIIRNARRHHCVPKEEIDAFKGLVRGVDYQICPNMACQVKVQLHDGCNQLICKFCVTTFCFICGEDVGGVINHWTTGMPCPRFGHPGQPRAIHDEVTGPGNDEAFDNHEFNHEFHLAAQRHDPPPEIALARIHTRLLATAHADMIDLETHLRLQSPDRRFPDWLIDAHILLHFLDDEINNRQRYMRHLRFDLELPANADVATLRRLIQGTGGIGMMWFPTLRPVADAMTLAFDGMFVALHEIASREELREEMAEEQRLRLNSLRLNTI